jgi:hypothetical protein
MRIRCGVGERVLATCASAPGQTCTTCAAGSFGPTCTLCADCTRNGGTCSEGLAGNCTCPASGRFVGALCDQCAANLHLSNNHQPRFSFLTPIQDGAPASGTWGFRWFYRDADAGMPSAEYPLTLDSTLGNGVTITSNATFHAFGLYSNATVDLSQARSFNGYLEVVRTTFVCDNDALCEPGFALVLHNGGLGYLGNDGGAFGLRGGALEGNSSFRSLVIRVIYYANVPPTVSLLINEQEVNGYLTTSTSTPRMKIWFSHDAIMWRTRIWVSVDTRMDQRPTMPLIDYTANNALAVVAGDAADRRNQFHVALMGASGNYTSTNVLTAARFDDCDPVDFNNDACFKRQCCPNFYGGDNCDVCADGYGSTCQYSRATCLQYGTLATDPATGALSCACSVERAGPQCEACAPGFFSVFGGSVCIPCQFCESGTCSNGQCQCRTGWTGVRCAECAVNFVSSWKDLRNVGPLGREGWTWTLNGAATSTTAASLAGQDLVLTQGSSAGGGALAASVYADTPFNVSATPCFSAVIYGSVSSSISEQCGDTFAMVLQNQAKTWLGGAYNSAGFYQDEESMSFNYTTLLVRTCSGKRLQVSTSNGLGRSVVKGTGALPAAMTASTYSVDFAMWVTYNCTAANPGSDGQGGTLSVYMNASANVGSNYDRTLARPATPQLTLAPFDLFPSSAVLFNPLFYVGFSGANSSALVQQVQISSDSILTFCNASDYVPNALAGGLSGCPSTAPLRTCCPESKAGVNCDECSPNRFGPDCMLCSVGCSQNGVCTTGIQGRCTCLPGYKGADCSGTGGRSGKRPQRRA